MMQHAVIVNADDLGLSREINDGIFSGLERGVITDVSLLIDAPYAREAVERLQEIGLRDVGLHINLDERLGWSSPGRERFSREELMVRFQDRGFLRRCRRDAGLQIERCIAAGLVPKHIDTHHHVHGFFELFILLVELAKEHRIPAMRHSRTGYTLTTRKPIPCDPSQYRRMEEILEEEGIFSCTTMVEGAHKVGEIASFPAELVVHPSSGGDSWRIREMGTLSSEAFREALVARGIKLAGYRDLIDHGPEFRDFPG
jgi:predicted glycoside hydrolase/deacetylase ChbG (UPF0249 family)